MDGRDGLMQGGKYIPVAQQIKDAVAVHIGPKVAAHPGEHDANALLPERLAQFTQCARAE